MSRQGLKESEGVPHSLLVSIQNMRIVQFSATRFRSLRSVKSWRPGALNVLIGPNGSGKSNVLRAIDLLAASAQGRLSKSIQSSGGMDPLIWDGHGNDFEFKVECCGDWKLIDSSRGYALRLQKLGGGGDFEIAAEHLADLRDARLERLGEFTQGEFVGFEGALRNMKVKPPAKKSSFSSSSYSAMKVRQGHFLSFLERTGTRVRLFDDSLGTLIPIDGEIPVQETMLSLAKGPFNRNLALSVFRTEVAGFSVYQDLSTNREAAIRRPTITRHEKRVDTDGQNLISVLHTLYTSDRDFKNEINDAMTAAFGSDFEELVFPPAADQRIQLRVRWKSLRREQSAADLSDGTLRFLFLLTVLASPDPAPLIAIDEPETGLHPSMLPIIAEYAVQASKRAQVIFTTHSPQFLDAFTDTQPQTTVVQRVDGETQLTALDPEQLKVWLQEYSLGSLFRSGELEGMA